MRRIVQGRHQLLGLNRSGLLEIRSLLFDHASYVLTFGIPKPGTKDAGN